MKLAVLILTLFFIAANLFTRWARRKTDGWVVQPMSAYLTGPLSLIQRLGFYSLTAVLILLASRDPLSLQWGIPLWIAAAALLLVVFTKLWQVSKSPVVRDRLERAHVACAGLAFFGTTMAEFHGSHHNQLFMLFPLTAAALALAFALFKRTETTALELVYASLITAWLVLWGAP